MRSGQTAKAVAGSIRGSEPCEANSAPVMLSAEIAQAMVLKIPSLRMSGSKKVAMVDCLFAKSFE